jgi:hypothetical protein
MDTETSSKDAVILIAEDDSAIALSENARPEIDVGAIRGHGPREQEPERTLILGWNDRAPTIITQLDGYVPSGSEVTVVAEDGPGFPAHELRNQTVAFRAGNTTSRRTLDELDVPSYDHVIVLSYSDVLDHKEADSRTLVTLLHLREIADQHGQSFSIVSDRLVSLMMCQVSENQELSSVFEDLIDPEGSELYLKPADEYVKPGAPLNFYTVVEAARRRGEVAVGYRVKAETGDPHKSYGVHLNPDKSQRITFTEGDRVIVLAES